MSWAGNRQLIYGGGALLVAALIVGGAAFLFSYAPPSCTDNVQNQNEEGVDCGGVCSKLCVTPKPAALWARSVKVADGVYHAVALVKNPENSAGTDSLPYSFTLYDADNLLIAERDGVIRLGPGETQPIVETNIVVGNRAPAHTYIEFKPAVWKRETRTTDPIVIKPGVVDSAGLSLNATVSNTALRSSTPLVVTALLYGDNDILIAASQTVLDSIPARGEASAIFTWQEPFTAPVVRAVVTARPQ